MSTKTRINLIKSLGERKTQLRLLCKCSLRRRFIRPCIRKHEDELIKIVDKLKLDVETRIAFKKKNLKP